MSPNMHSLTPVDLVSTITSNRNMKENQYNHPDIGIAYVNKSSLLKGNYM